MSRVLDVIYNSKKNYGERDSIVYRVENDYKSINYNQLFEYMNSLAFYLEKYKNKTIAIIGNNKLEYTVSLLSIISYIGDVFLIDKELSEEDINNIFKIKKPDLIILDDELKIKFSKYDTLLFSDINKLSQIQNMFSQYERLVGKLYEADSKYNLTSLEKVKDINGVLNRKLMQVYGGEVYDFSDKNYALYGHVISDTEAFEDLLNGKIKLNRVLYSSSHYPAEYGYIDETLSEDVGTGDSVNVEMYIIIAAFVGALIGAVISAVVAKKKKKSSADSDATFGEYPQV